MSTLKSSLRKARTGRSALFNSVFETLESRQLLSTTPIIGEYTPWQLRTAYGVSALGAANEGQGTTIGIVDELNDTSITTDLKNYSSYYGLPLLDGVGGDPTFTVVNDTALGSVGSASGTGVGEETALDVEMAHAMAPLANIILVQVPATGSYANEFAELLHGIALAATDGAKSVSLSYGIGESSIGTASVVTTQNSTYLSTGSAAGISVSVSTGDSGSPEYPATSPNVVAVGGTSLFLSSVKGNYSFETGWGGVSGAGAGGGGLSTDFSLPTFQSANGLSYAKRSIPDVSLVADPYTGVSIYDSYDYSSSPWQYTGGTSVASPVFAGIMALAQQNRTAAGLAPLNSVQINTAMYSLYNSPAYSTYFNDVTLGSNKDVGGAAGFSATTGYDEATGLGSPIANTLIPYLSTYTPTQTTTIKLGGIGAVGAKLSGGASLSTDSSTDSTSSSVSLYNLLPNTNGSKAMTPAFVKAVSQAQNSPVVSAAPLVDSVEVTTPTHSVLTLVGSQNVPSSVAQGNYSAEVAILQAGGLMIDDSGLSKDVLDSLAGSIVS